MKLTCSTFILFNYFFNTFFARIKISKDSSAKHYPNNKDRLQKKLVKDIKVFLKKKTRQYGCERYKYLPENEEQKLVEYRRNYYKMRQNALLQL